MALVGYPDSDSDQGDSSNAMPSRCSKGAVKRKHGDAVTDALPPLPAAFHDLYSANARVSTSDDPSLHSGRKRAIPHVEGIWPSHIYLEWIPSQAESDSLHSLIQCVRDSLQHRNRARLKPLPLPRVIPLLQSELGAPLPLHVSLSRTLQIRTEDRTTFLGALSSALRRTSISAFHSRLRGLKWVPNFDQNRWFLVLGIDKPAQDELNRLLTACNKAAESSGHPSLYSGGHGDGPMENSTTDTSVKRSDDQQNDAQQIDRSDRFHVSIAWSLEEPDQEWISLVKSLDVTEHINAPQAAFEAVKARVGNTVHSIDLQTRSSMHVTHGGISGSS